MMPSGEVLDMIVEALGAMALAIPGVFLVLTVFLVLLKLSMSLLKGSDPTDASED